MNKADKILIATLWIISLILLIPLWKSQNTGNYAKVLVKGEEVLRIDLATNTTQTVQGTLGPVHIEVKNGEVGVTQENSPYHYCSKQGFTSSGVIPIVCLPNETVVVIESNDVDQEDTVIQ